MPKLQRVGVFKPRVGGYATLTGLESADLNGVEVRVERRHPTLQGFWGVVVTATAQPLGVQTANLTWPM